MANPGAELPAEQRVAKYLSVSAGRISGRLGADYVINEAYVDALEAELAAVKAELTAKQEAYLGEIRYADEMERRKDAERLLADGLAALLLDVHEDATDSRREMIDEALAAYNAARSDAARGTA